MRIYNVLLTGLIIIMFVSCSRYYVKVDYDKNIDFYEYETYKWMQPKAIKTEQNIFTNSLNQKRFATAIEKELSIKGYKKIEENKPDFRIIYHIRLKTKIDFPSFGYKYLMGHGRIAGFTQYTTYEEGTFIIDIIDAKQKQLIWRGFAEGALEEIEDIEEQIISVVTNVFKDFPPED